MMVIIRSIMLTKSKETITCTDASCLSTQHWLVCCTNKLKRSETFCDCFNWILLKMCFYSNPHCHSFTFIWLKTCNFESSWPFNTGTKQTKITLETVKSWTRLLRGGRSIEIFIIVYRCQFFRDFGSWPPKLGGPLNRGSTCCMLLLIKDFLFIF